MLHPAGWLAGTSWHRLGPLQSTAGAPSTRRAALARSVGPAGECVSRAVSLDRIDGVAGRSERWRPVRLQEIFEDLRFRGREVFTERREGHVEFGGNVGRVRLPWPFEVPHRVGGF
jgi:hypothetical protein